MSDKSADQSAVEATVFCLGLMFFIAGVGYFFGVKGCAIISIVGGLFLMFVAVYNDAD